MNTYLASIDQNGKMQLYDRNGFLEEVYQHKGKDIELSIKKIGRRGNNQNRYYWGAIIPIVKNGLKELGILFTSKRVHDLLKYKFLIQEFNTSDGEIIQTVGSSKELTSQEFNEYIDRIKQWSAEYLNIVIPDAGEQTAIDIESVPTRDDIESK